MANQVNPSTQSGWVIGLIQGLGAKASARTIAAVTAWTNAEGVWGKTGGSTANNPLGITIAYGVPTTGTFNSAGVLEFATPEQGLQATIRFIQNRTPTIITALKGNASAAQLYTVVNGTGWAGAGGYPTPWTGGTPSKYSNNAVTTAISRPGGAVSTPSVDQLLASETGPQPRVGPGGSQTGVQLDSALGNIISNIPIIGSVYSGASDVVNGVEDFLKLIAWILNPVTWLRAVEFLTGIGLMGFGIHMSLTSFKNATGTVGTGIGFVKKSRTKRIARAAERAAV